MIVSIYGSSDDLIEVDGCKGADEFNNAGSGLLKWRGDLIAPDGGQIRVYAIYDGCWHFSVGQVDEGVLLPSWPVSIAPGEQNAYSVDLVIDVPDGTRLTNIWPAVPDEDD